MMRRFFMVMAVLALAAYAAQAQTTVKKVPIKGTAINGETMFKQ